MGERTDEIVYAEMRRSNYLSQLIKLGVQKAVLIDVEQGLWLKCLHMAAKSGHCGCSTGKGESLAFFAGGGKRGERGSDYMFEGTGEGERVLNYMVTVAEVVYIGMEAGVAKAVRDFC